MEREKIYINWDENILCFIEKVESLNVKLTRELDSKKNHHITNSKFEFLFYVTKFAGKSTRGKNVAFIRGAQNAANKLQRASVELLNLVCGVYGEVRWDRHEFQFREGVKI